MEILNLRLSCKQSVALLLLVISLAQLPVVLGQEVTEHALKAAFLYNFTKFVEWPHAIATPFFAICILGDDPLEWAIERMTAGKTAYGRPLQVRRLKDEAEAKQCQIVFVGSTERGKAARLIDATRRSAVLTVGESQEFLRTGGMVVLSMENSRVSIVINKAATDGEGLKISAKLMTLARIYKP